jgi:hypothetical protein
VLGAGDHLAHHHGAEMRVTARGRLAHDGDQLAQHLGRRARRLGQALDARHDLRERELHDGEVELPLAAEVVVDHRLVDAGPLGEDRHRHAVVAALGEQLGARAQQRPPRGRGIAPARALPPLRRHRRGGRLHTNQTYG